MPADPIDRQPPLGRPPGARHRRLMRLILEELVTAPPPEGDRVTHLAHALDHRVSDVRDAVDCLVRDGLARADDETIRPTDAALTFAAVYRTQPIRDPDAAE